MKDSINITWHIDDVLYHAEHCGVNINKRQARDVLHLMSDNHDATIGINWNTIEYWTEYVIERDWV